MHVCLNACHIGDIVKNKRFLPDFIFVLDWFQYRLTQCYQKVSTPPPYSKPIILEDYRVNGLIKITKLVCARLPDNVNDLHCHLDPFLSALQQYSSETRRWQDVVDRKERFYNKERAAQQAVDAGRRSQGKPILLPKTCIYFHEHDAELHMNWHRQKLGGKSSAGIRHKMKSASGDVSVVPNKIFKRYYNRAYRIQGGSLWLNQQIIDKHNIEKKEPILWPIDFTPVQFFDSQYATVCVNGEEHPLDVFDIEEDKIFTFCDIRHKRVTYDQYIKQYGLPERIPDAPVGKFYIQRMVDVVNKFKGEWEIAASPFSEVVSIVKAIACESATPGDYVNHSNRALNIIQELKNGTRPKFLHAVNEAMLKIIKSAKDRRWELELPEPAAAERDLEHTVFEIQERVFTQIYNVAPHCQLRRRIASDDSSGNGAEDIARKFFACTDRARTSARGVAAYGLIALEHDDMTDSEIIKIIKERIFTDTLEEKICTRARAIFRDNFGVIFKESNPKIKSFKCIGMDSNLVSTLSQIVDKKITKKDLT